MRPKRTAVTHGQLRDKAFFLGRCTDDPELLFTLATLHSQGLGLAKDDARAFALYKTAADAGTP